MKKLKCKSCGYLRFRRTLTQTEVAECHIIDHEKEALGLEDVNIDIISELEPHYLYACAKCGKKAFEE